MGQKWVFRHWLEVAQKWVQSWVFSVCAFCCHMWALHELHNIPNFTAHPEKLLQQLAVVIIFMILLRNGPCLDREFWSGNAEGSRNPWVIKFLTGVLIYLPVISRPLISLQKKKAVLSPCNFATTHLTACILNFCSPFDFATHETEDPRVTPKFWVPQLSAWFAAGRTMGTEQNQFRLHTIGPTSFQNE